LFAAAGTAVVAVGVLGLFGSGHSLPILLQALVGRVLLAVALLALLIKIALTLTCRSTGFLRVEVIVPASSLGATVLRWDGR
jgi:hypothetical protein